MGRPSRYAPEVRERAVRMVFEHQGEHDSQWAAIESIAEKFGCTSETLRMWVRQAERDGGKRSGLTTEQRQRLRDLERENREQRRTNEILGRAGSLFAQAELDCRPNRWRMSSRRIGTCTGSGRSAACCRSPRRRFTSTRPAAGIATCFRLARNRTNVFGKRSRGYGVGGRTDLRCDVARLRVRGLHRRCLLEDDRRLASVEFSADGSRPGRFGTGNLVSHGHRRGRAPQRPRPPVPVDSLHRKIGRGRHRALGRQRRRFVPQCPRRVCNRPV